MYFSVINPAREHLRDAIRDMIHTPYGMHQWIWKFFDEDADAKRDFIFRRHDDGQLPRMYVVSARPPVSHSEDWEVQTRDYAPQPAAGQRFSFVLCANPAVAKKGPDGKSRRHDVVMQAKKDGAKGGELTSAELVEKTCLAWLHARAEQAGFEVVGATVNAYRQHQADSRKKNKEIQFTSVDFAGELIVRDPAAFQRTLLQGLGHAKAFGCGLLLVRPVSQAD